MRITKKVFSIILALVMVLSLLPAMAFAVEADEFTVVVSMEGLTLGQGMYVEPKAYTLDELNTLLEEAGYGSYDEDTMTAAMATVAMFQDQGLEYNYTGSPESGFYLSAVQGLDNGNVNIPDIIADNGGPSNDTYEPNDDDYLGEFDYSWESGWMITVNDNMIYVGSSDWDLVGKVSEGCGQDYGNVYVIRWQFTLSGYGADLGFDSGWGATPYYTHANKDLLYAAYALSDDAEAKKAALPVMEKLDATQEEVDAALALFDAVETPDREAQDVSAVLNATMAKLATTVTAPQFGTSAGEWTVLSLARGSYYEKDNTYFIDYYDRIAETVNQTAASVNLNGALHKNKSTENSRLIMALSAIGKDSTGVGDWNLITPFDDFSWITRQGINGPIFALIALDTNNYTTGNDTIRQQCVDYILKKQLSDGGWALSGAAADPDITSMALQALYNYREQTSVKEAAEKGINCLSNMQNANGGYTSWGSVNCESIAQVIVACTTWGINPDTDSRFVKNGHSAVDALLEFYVKEEAAFKHVQSGSTDAMATDQGCYALVAYDRLLKGKTALYDMSDVSFDDMTPDTDEMTAMLGLPAEINPGDGFNGIISINKWDNEAGYKLIDFIVTVPEGVTVTGVTASDRLSGGKVSYNLEAETGKLRVVYFDANENSDITVSGEAFPAELFTIGFKADSAAAGSKLNIAISGMSAKRHSNPADEDAMDIVNTDTTSGSVDVVEGISFSAVCLYEGDDVDLIPSTKKAVAVAVTGIAGGTKLTYNDGANAVTFKYSAEITAKTGVATYVALVDAGIDMADFVNPSYFKIGDGSAAAITFGDSNGDGVINAQDALAAVDAWLRKGEELTDDAILTLNVNSDSRINTFDALGIVEKFVNGNEYGVVTKAATITTQP